MDILELMSSGNWHIGFHPKIGNALKNASNLCYKLNSLPPWESDKRRELIQKLLGKVGDDFIIHSPFRCDIGSNIRIGKRLICNYNVAILDEAPVTIGDNVFIGPNTTICTITHSLDSGQRNDGVMRALPVTIGNNVWICACVTILPGVEIGDGSVVGAGSLVTKSIPAGVLAMGCPCRVVRTITEEDEVGPILQPDSDKQI